jgi:hypothetical protein
VAATRIYYIRPLDFEKNVEEWNGPQSGSKALGKIDRCRNVCSCVFQDGKSLIGFSKCIYKVRPSCGKVESFGWDGLVTPEKTEGTDI